MLNGNPNKKLRVSVPMPQNSRYAQGRDDMMGLGVESLQGNALQTPSKINSIPGHGQMTAQMSPELRRLLDSRRMANAVPKRRTASEVLGF